MPTFSYDDHELTDKDRIRGLIGDTQLGGWIPGRWLLSDESIQATINQYTGNFWESAVQCAMKAGRQAETAYVEVHQGERHGIQIKFNTIKDIQDAFAKMIKEFREYMQPQPGQPASNGAIGGKVAFNPDCFPAPTRCCGYGVP